MYNIIRGDKMKNKIIRGDKMKRTVIAPTNIAFVKYWGKHLKYERYHIPNKSSASFTVDGLFTKTTIEVADGAGQVEFTLNGKRIEPQMKEGKYVYEFLNKVKERYPFIKNYDYRVISENNFPTAAGFASSASGFAAFARCLVEVLPEFKDIRDDDKAISILARLGSGSATRSIPRKGGVVLWRRGIEPGERNKDVEEVIKLSYAETIIPPEEVEEIRIIYIKVETGEKKIKSRAGMKTSVHSCPLYWKWIEYEENSLLPSILNALKEKDWKTFFKLTMMASNGLHAICHYTYPPIFYLNDISKSIITKIDEINENAGEEICSYTFDAGPNAVIFTTKDKIDEVLPELEAVAGKENVIETKVGKGPRVEE